MTAHFQIDAATVRHMAFLVRVGIRDEEAEAFSPQLSAIIDYFNLLNEVDTSQVPPATQLPGLRNILRPDEVAPSMARADFLANVPCREGKFVRVPAVLSEE
jgi:aspartyl-tRNA(Asn)/glutamyl-tRNA(Gln) amidotransferase subunit C